MDILSRIFLVFTPSVGVKHFIAPTPSVGVVHNCLTGSEPEYDYQGDGCED